MTKSYILAATLLISSSAIAAEPFGADAQIYGYLASGSAGMYTLAADGYNLLWEDTGFKSRWYVPMTSGWLIDGKMCGYANDGYDAFYVEYDWESGEILKSESMSASNCPVIATYNEADGKIYGYMVKGDECKFFTAPVDDPKSPTLVATGTKAETCLGLTYNSSEGYVVGARYDGNLVKVNADGSQESLIDTHYTQSSYTSYTAIAYSSADNLYYWNPTNNDFESEMYVVDCTERYIGQVSTFPDKQFRFMLSAGQAVETEAPVAPEIVEALFIEGSADGKFIVRMPDVTEGGATISGNVKWTATIDGQPATDGEAAAGAEVTVEFEGIATGNHTFAFTASVGEYTGKSASQTLYVGFDTPKSPANVVLTETKVSWDAVTAGVNGGYVNTQAITYTVSLNDEVVGTTTDLSYALENLSGGELRRVVATVTATANGMSSAPGVSNGLTTGTLSLPVHMQPTADDFDVCQVIDGDGNGMCWSYDEANEAFFARYNYDAQVDDWLILPAINLSTTKTYSLSFEARKMRSFFDEALEVRAAMEPTAEALANGIQVLDRIDLPASYTEYEGTFTPTASGQWYIAIHAVSDADNAGMYVKELNIVQSGALAVAPAEVIDLQAVPAEDAALEATVTFTLPSTTIGGDALDNDTEIEVTITAAATVKVTGKPGERISATVTTAQGDNRISVQPAIGDEAGPTSYVEVYTGYDIPDVVSNVAAVTSEDMMSASISWDAPEYGIAGGVIDPEAMTYTIYQQVSTSVGTYWEAVEEGVKTTSYTFNAPATVQDAYTLGIAAVSVAGTCPVIVSTPVVLGTPYDLPMADTFDTPPAYYTYNYWVTYMPDESYATEWGILPVEVLPFFDTTDWNVTLCGMGLMNGAKGRAGFPVFSTKGYEAVQIKAPFWTGAMSTPDLRIIGMAYGMEEPIEVGVVTSTGDWNEVSFQLPAELIDREWVKLFLEASFPQGSSQWVCMDSYTISPCSAIADANADVTSVRAVADAIEITSEGGVAYTVYSVDGRVIASGVTAQGVTTQSVAPGIYLTAIAGQTFRLAVK